MSVEGEELSRRVLLAEEGDEDERRGIDAGEPLPLSVAIVVSLSEICAASCAFSVTLLSAFLSGGCEEEDPTAEESLRRLRLRDEPDAVSIIELTAEGKCRTGDICAARNSTPRVERTDASGAGVVD